ncbi:MAG: glycoside hydrolase family 2 TIM barrel-domain containing protein [Lachnospiraceae bacterium]
MNRKRLFNDNWEFVKTPYGTGIEELSDWEKGFQRVDIPHDWLVHDTRNLYETGTGWYRKRFEVTGADGYNRLLRFDGVYMDSRVYVNGQLAGEWKYGYSTFEFDITKYLHAGENMIMVRVDHHEPNSRWYSGAGIYRNVWLKTVPETYLASDGIYVTTKRQGQIFVVEIEAELAGRMNDGRTDNAAQLKGYAGCFATVRVSFEGNVVKEGRLEREEGSNLLKGMLRVENPKIWDAEDPNLYQLEVELDNGDKDTVTFGFREFTFDPEQGFVANGRRVKLHGVCEHHDLGCLGAAFNKAAMRRKMVTLKKMGVNAIRTSHNMPAPELMELADEMGFYIDSEAFDMWMEPKTEYDYARFFDEWAEIDVASWIRRDRNHPSVIMWSIGNEIHDTHNPEGLGLTKRLKKAVEEHDPKKNARVTIGSNYMPWQGAQNCADIVKLAGYNYAEIHYDNHHAAHPDWIIYGSETSSIVQSRGVYHFPLAQSILTEEDEQCSAFGNSRPSWAAKSVEYCICVDRDRDYAAGQFLWTGHDYIGEPTPYKTKNSYFGQIDTAGFPKDTYYMYQAEWTHYKKAPMIYLMPYWDFNPGQLIDIRVCSNAPVVEVFVNEKSLGKKEIDHVHGTDLFPSFQVPYEPGCIRAVAYDEKGNVIAEDSHKSFGDSAKITLKADKAWMKADGQDLIFVEIGMEDAEGNPVENAMDYVEVDVSGAGRLVGLDNGDSTDYDQYKGTCRKLFNGKLLAVIAAKTEPGPVSITVRDIGVKEDIEPAKLLVQAVATEVPEGVSAIEENKDEPLVTGKPDMIPVRKIELVSEDGQVFSENKTDIVVKAYLYPADATDKEVVFSVVNDAGITSNLAEVEILPAEENGSGSTDGNQAVRCRVHAKGDGAFRLRAAVKNGTDKVKLLSQLEFSVSGLGEAYLDPYGFIAGALYNYSVGDVGGFSEKSVASAQEGISIIGYKGLDFGEYGSDEITLPIFTQSGDPHYLQIWEGIPEEEGSEMLADVVYQKPSIWDVYQPETYKLKRRIKGIATLCFVIKDQRYFIKGFSFTKPEKAYEKLYATEYNNLYGDTFTVKEDAVEGIGNNVSLEYENMDFGEKGFTQITICGRTKLPANSIHIRFFAESGEAVNQLVEFPHSEEYTEVTFPLQSITGKNKVIFVFLPGCDFDFKWFQFS